MIKQKTYTCNRQNAHTKYSLALHLQQDNDMYFRNRIHIILRIQCLFLDIVCPIQIEYRALEQYDNLSARPVGIVAL